MGPQAASDVKRVGDFMTREPISVSADTSMKDAMALLQRHHIRHLPVVDGTALVGLVTDRDVRKATPSLLTGIGREDYEQVLIATPVARIMTKEPVTLSSESPVVDAVRLMVERKFGSLPVVDGGNLVGIFTEIDALKIVLNELAG